MQHNDERRGPKTCLRCCKCDEMTMMGPFRSGTMGGDALLFTWLALCLINTWEGEGDAKIVQIGAGKRSGGSACSTRQSVS